MKCLRLLTVSFIFGELLFGVSAQAKPAMPEAIQKIAWMQGHWTCDSHISINSKKGKKETHTTAKYKVSYNPLTKTIDGDWQGPTGTSVLRYGYDPELKRYEISVMSTNVAQEPTAAVIQMGRGQLTKDGIAYIGTSFYQDYKSKYTKTFHLIDSDHYHTVITTDNDAIKYHVAVDINCSK